MPEISVIVPVYKVEPYLRRCVDSILAQTFIDFELILVDDGSPDNSGAICDEYATKDTRIHVIHQKNGGAASARNTGIDWVLGNSVSKWLTFIDSDDWVHPKMFELLYNTAIQHSVKVSICGFEETDGTKQLDEITSAPIQIWDTEEYFYKHHAMDAIVPWGKLYHRDCFAYIRYPVGKICEDELTTYKILFLTDKLAATTSPMYYYFYNNSGVSKARWTPKNLAALEAFEERMDFFKEKGMEKLYKQTVDTYNWKILWTKQQITECYTQDEGKQHLQMLSERAKKLLMQKDIKLMQGINIYCMAYPKREKFYMLLYRVRNKIKNIFGKEK